MASSADEQKNDQSLLSPAEGKGSRLASMLSLEKSGKVVEVNEDGAFDMSDSAAEEERTLMDELLADAEEVQFEKNAKKKAEEKRLKKKFGSGLKKGFFSETSSEKKKSQKIETVKPSKKKTEPSLQNKMKAEVQESMQSDSPWKMLMTDPRWLTPELLDQITANPRLRNGLTNPKYQEVFELMRKNPEEAKKKFEHDKELNAVMFDLCQLMGTHFTEVGTKYEAEKRYKAIEKELGPLAAEIAAKYDQEQKKLNQKKNEASISTTPESTPDSQHNKADSTNKKNEISQAQVNAILNDENLRTLLSDPRTQRLMQRCADPTEFAQAMADPDARAKIHTLAKAGLVRVA